MTPPPKALPLQDGDDETRSTRTGALVTGSVAIGALITHAVLEKARHRAYPLPVRLPNAVNHAQVGALEIMEGVTRFYRRPGEGTPVVLLHSINAAGSAHEMKPLWDHFASTTNRPVYALEWLGFGKSDRPPVRYAPGLYQRQLRRFLSECVGEPADVVALSLAGEYAATVANAFPVLFRKLAIISPTALDSTGERTPFKRALVATAGKAGVFELMFSRLTEEDALRSFYDRQIFASGRAVPAELVEYAYVTTHIRGAHFAPMRFIQGELFMGDYALRGYRSLRTSTFMIIPDQSPSAVQRFDLADSVATENTNVTLHRTQTGLLPHWEEPEAVASTLDEFFLERREKLTVDD